MCGEPFSRPVYASMLHPVEVAGIVCETVYSSILRPQSNMAVISAIKREEKLREEQERKEQEAIKAAQEQKAHEEYMASFKSLGTFKLSYYCPCAKCNGNTRGITASGAKLQPGVSIAVDKSVIPLGSTVLINGKEYKAHDTGGAIKGNRIDICVGSHAEALRLGRTTATIYVKK